VSPAVGRQGGGEAGEGGFEQDAFQRLARDQPVGEPVAAGAQQCEVRVLLERGGAAVCHRPPPGEVAEGRLAVPPTRPESVLGDAVGSDVPGQHT
jgi:hypothetical protein